MLKKITHVTLYIPNQDEALEFYTKNLGFVLHTDAMFGPDLRWLTIVLPEQKEVEIVLALPESDEERALVGKQAGRKPFLAFSCDDCQKTHDDLKEKGVTIINAPEKQSWGTSMACADPWGNIIYIVEENA